jgi:hypothetical protein
MKVTSFLELDDIIVELSAQLVEKPNERSRGSFVNGGPDTQRNPFPLGNPQTPIFVFYAEQ